MEVDRDAITRAVLDYLRFSDVNRQVAEEIAEETAARIMAGPSVGTGRLSLAQMIALEARATIRHTYTAYDDVLIENTLEQADLTMGRRDDEAAEPVTDEVSEFIERNRK